MSDVKALDTDSLVLQAMSQRSERHLAFASSKARGEHRSDIDLKQASEQFEALLLNLMIREMRATVPEPALFEHSMAEEMFTGMLDEQVAGKIAGSGGIGLARLIFDQLKGAD